MTTDNMTSRLLWPIWYGAEFLHLKFSVYYHQISDNMTNIFSISLIRVEYFFPPRTYNFAFSSCVFSVLMPRVRRSVCALYRVLMTKQSHSYDVDLLGLWLQENWLQSVTQSYYILCLKSAKNVLQLEQHVAEKSSDRCYSIRKTWTFWAI